MSTEFYEKIVGTCRSSLFPVLQNWLDINIIRGKVGQRRMSLESTSVGKPKEKA